MSTNHNQSMSGITIRRLVAGDVPAVKRLVELDSADEPAGDLLGAEIEGRLVAVTPLDGGTTLADPFSRTGELRDLLELRAAQLRGRESTAPRRGLLRRRGQATLAGSPPGAGGRLLSLPVRS